MDPNSLSELPNAGRRVRIPAGPTRAILVVAAAVLAGAITVAAVLLTHGGGGARTVHHKPLAGRPPLFLELPGPAVTGGVDAVYAAARARLPSSDPRVAVARAIAGYRATNREQTVA